MCTSDSEEKPSSECLCLDARYRGNMSPRKVRPFYLSPQRWQAHLVAGIDDYDKFRSEKIHLMAFLWLFLRFHLKICTILVVLG
jgi:uncharacterized short protein YbdD (DUF466 family)